MGVQVVPNGTPGTSNIVLTTWQWLGVIASLATAICALGGAFLWLDSRSMGRDTNARSNAQTLLKDTEVRIEGHLTEFSVRNDADHASIKKELEGLPPQPLLADVAANKAAIHQNMMGIKLLEKTAQDTHKTLEEIRDWMRRHENTRHGEAPE